MRSILTAIAFVSIFASVASAGVIAKVPEPATVSLLVVGAAALYGLHRRRGRK
jgi:hypothetical protein